MKMNEKKGDVRAWEKGEGGGSSRGEGEGEREGEE